MCERRPWDKECLRTRSTFLKGFDEMEEFCSANRDGDGARGLEVAGDCTWRLVLNVGMHDGRGKVVVRVDFVRGNYV